MPHILLLFIVVGIDHVQVIPGGQLLAVVHPIPFGYLVKDGDHKLIVAAELRESLEKKLKRPLEVLETKKGADLVGLSYVPPFDVFFKEHKDLIVKLAAAYEMRAFWRVLAADFVDEPGHTTAEALDDATYVFATTARQRDLTKPVFTPEAAMAEALQG